MTTASGFSNDPLFLLDVARTKAARPAERPKACPQCGRSSLKRRVRQQWERVLCAVTTPAVKIRPYQCTQCRHRNWEVVRWAQPSDLLVNRIILAGTIAAGIITAAILAWSMPGLVLPQEAAASSMQPLEVPTRLSQLIEPTTPRNVAPTALPATFLESATLEKLDGRRALLLRDNGAMREYQTWMQKDQRNRFVIDFPGFWTLGDKVPDSMNLKGTHADRINIIQYPEHLRVSIRLRSDASGMPQIVQTPEGLNILLD